MVDTIVKIVGFITTNYQAIVSGLVAVLGGLVAICLVIPGEQPEKTFQSISDFLKKFSVK